jgi:hypothetical protein
VSRARGRRRGHDHEGQQPALLCSALLGWPLQCAGRARAPVTVAVARMGMDGHWRSAGAVRMYCAQPRCTPAWSGGSPFTKKGSPTTVPCGRGTKAGEREKKNSMHIYLLLSIRRTNLP